jgi:hypothetical protein
VGDECVVDERRVSFIISERERENERERERSNDDEVKWIEM